MHQQLRATEHPRAWNTASRSEATQAIARAASVPPQVSALSPKAIGLNSELSTVPLPLEPGKRVKIFLGGEGVDQVPGTSILVNSPYFTIDPATGIPARRPDGRLSLRAVNLILEQIGRWHDAELKDPSRHISPLAMKNTRPEP